MFWEKSWEINCKTKAEAIVKPALTHWLEGYCRITRLPRPSLSWPALSDHGWFHCSATTRACVPDDGLERLELLSQTVWSQWKITLLSLHYFLPHFNNPTWPCPSTLYPLQRLLPYPLVVPEVFFLFVRPQSRDTWLCHPYHAPLSLIQSANSHYFLLSQTFWLHSMQSGKYFFSISRRESSNMRLMTIGQWKTTQHGLNVHTTPGNRG